MKPGSVKIFDRVSAVEVIKKLDEEDLRFLNELIVERLNLIFQAKATTSMARFSKVDRVGFVTSDGQPVEGVVVRLNKKTVSVDTDDGGRWKVSPRLLKLLESRQDILSLTWRDVPQMGNYCHQGICDG